MQLNNTEIYVNPEVMQKLQKNIKDIYPGVYSPYGFKIRVNQYIPKHPKKWEFPKCRFVEYEPKDEEWARPLRHGREVDDTSQYIGFAIKAQEYLMKHISFMVDKEVATVACSGIIPSYLYEKYNTFGQINFEGKGSYYPANIVSCD